MQKPRAHAEIYNDLDDDIVNVFRQFQSPMAAAAIEHRLRYTPFARTEFERAYEPTEDPIERAARTIIRSFLGFGSRGSVGRTGFRTNSNRSGTTPAREWTTYPKHIKSFVARLSGVVLEHRPAVELLTRKAYVREDTLAYVDPPYVHSTRSGSLHSHGYRCEMSDDDHRDLAAVLRATTMMVIVSGYRCDLYDELYAGWTRFDISSRKMMNLDAIESIWLSAATVRKLGDGMLFFGDAP